MLGVQVKLTEREHHHCEPYIDAVPGLADAFRQGRRLNARTSVVIDMAAIGWLLLREQMAPHAFGALGGATKKMPLRAALRTITTELNEQARHPAMFGQARRGWYPVQVLGFFLAPGDVALSGSREHQRRYSPYPFRDRPGVILKPRTFAQQGIEMTSWSAVSAHGEDAEELSRQFVFGCHVEAGRIDHFDWS